MTTTCDTLGQSQVIWGPPQPVQICSLGGGPLTPCSDLFTMKPILYRQADDWPSTERPCYLLQPLNIAILHKYKNITLSHKRVNDDSRLTMLSHLRKVMFSQASVILFTGRCLGDTPLWPPRQTPPLGRPPLGRHPHPRATPPGQTPTLNRHTPWTDSPRQMPPPQQMATAADGTHPTGMHSCSKYEPSHS